MNRQLVLTTVFALLALPLSGVAQKAVSQGASVTATAVIQAIDSSTRMVTVKNADGSLETIFCGPDVKRFDALKVGDKVTVRYYESLVYAIQKPGDTPPVPNTTAVTRTSGEKPGGTIAHQMTATVTVREIDSKVPSITITTEAGDRMSFKVEDRKNLQGLKAGDKVQITYTEAFAISVEAPKK